MMDIKIGVIVYGKGGVGNPVTAIDNDMLTIDTPNGLRLVNVSKILRVENPTSNPSDAISRLPGRIEVNLDRLSLEYQPTVTTPSWEPTTSVKPYEELTKLYLDIETTGLDPLVDRVLMVGLMSQTGEKVIITDPDEKVTLTIMIDYLKANKPDCLIGHNLINFDVPISSYQMPN
jgi:uncharacterized protein YprB with RNaseH-like and TPR domain